MNAFDDVWLSRYPRPEYIGFDNGVECKNVFDLLVNNYGVNQSNSTPFNPQSNGITERLYSALNDALINAEVDGREFYETDPWGPFLSSDAYAIRSTFHTTLKATPGKLVFGRDMVLPIICVADWEEIEQRQKEMAYNNIR
jgi:hypothetical protein